MHLMHIMSGTRKKLLFLQFRQHLHPRTSIINKMVLSSSPLTNPLDYTLMIAYEFGSMMAYWRPGDKTFTLIDTHPVSDLILYNGFFYSVNSCSGAIQVINGSLTRMKLHRGVIPSDIQCYPMGFQTYLVESNGDLLLVVRFHGEVDKDSPQNVEAQVYFCVYKIETLDGKICRVSGEMESLGNRAIFVASSNASFSVNACEIPGCKPNHIYFTGRIPDFMDPDKEKHHMGVYSLRDGLMEHWGCGRKRPYCSCLSPPLWVTPTLV